MVNIYSVGWDLPTHISGLVYSWEAKKVVNLVCEISLSGPDYYRAVVIGQVGQVQPTTFLAWLYYALIIVYTGL